jgi:pSer/pThr/pTyr-binding forkhead associated (FHA) protein
VLRRIQLPGLQAVEIFHDVLATPILEWRDDYVRAAERVRERRRLRRRILQGAAVALLLIGLLGYRAYSLWLENRPWGVLTNLSTGMAHAVTGTQFTVGRNTQHYQNQVNLLPNTISRMHLMIFRNLVAVDMRSYNGTTVNAEFLQYGDSVTLRSGDIIVLGGTAPFRFATIQYARFQFWTPFLEQHAPTPGWGLLIDARSRTVTSLERPEHFLSVRDGAIVPLEDEGTDAVLAIRLTGNGAMTVQCLSESVESWIGLKEDDHKYGRFRLKAGVVYDRMKQYGQWSSLFAATFTVGDARFQVIPIEKNLEPGQ